MWHGWSDQLIYPGGSIDYYTRVQQAMGGAAKTAEFLRFFLAPGVAHCGGGPGPAPSGQFEAMVRWVEEGKRPGHAQCDPPRSIRRRRRDRARCASTRRRRTTKDGEARTKQPTSSAGSASEALRHLFLMAWGPTPTLRASAHDPPRGYQLRSSPCPLALRPSSFLSQAPIDLVPVDDVPPRGEIVGAAILVVQVVGVFPDVDAEDGLLALHHRVVLVRRALDRQLAG